MSYAERFIAEDGMMCLAPHPSGDRPPFPGQEKRTSNNDNGLLFRAEFELLNHLRDGKTYGTRDEIAALIRSLEAQTDVHGGLFWRNPGRRDNTSFDEYTGIMLLTVLFDLPDVARIICKRGDQTGYIFNAEDPDSPPLSNWRQGIDVATYKACAGITPTPYEYLWVWLGTLWGFKSKPGDTSDVLLNWCRLHTWRLLYEKKREMGKVLEVMVNLTLLLQSIFELEMRIRRGGLATVMRIFFGMNHPNTLIAEELSKR